MPADTHDGTYDAFAYSVTLDGHTVAGFSETSGLSSDEHTTVTLKRGVTGSTDFRNWMRGVRSPGAPGTEKDLVVTMHDERRRPVRAWRIVGARCRRIVGPAIHPSGGNITAIESLDLTCDAVRPA